MKSEPGLVSDSSKRCQLAACLVNLDLAWTQGVCRTIIRYLSYLQFTLLLRPTGLRFFI